jgi:cyclophilin family peptidyl-prolyl cis-trans isomerase/HEAT repeat protein
MIKRSIIFFLFSLMGFVVVGAQVPLNIGVQILKAEDARRYDAALEKLIADPNMAIRNRAALAAGRIGDERAIPALVNLLENEAAINVTAMAAFAIGEIESAKGADAILKTLQDPKTPNAVRARAVEAAGKIAAANPKDEKAKELGDAILVALNTELADQKTPDTQTIRLALTAALRTRPAGAEEVVRKFLAFTDPSIVGDALNTLARLKAKNANRDARDLLASHVHAIVRANAARVLGAAEDKEAVDILLKAAVGDVDSRVRVSAIRALGNLKEVKAAEKLLDHAETLLASYKKSKFATPIEKNELIEIATVLGRLLTNSGNARATKLLGDLFVLDRGMTAEIGIARLRIAPGNFEDGIGTKPAASWRQWSVRAQFLGELATLEAKSPEATKIIAEAPDLTKLMAYGFAINPTAENKKFIFAGPDFLRAFAEFKTNDADVLLLEALQANDVFVRATAAELLAEQPSSRTNFHALETAFTKALATDKQYDDAQLAILDAMFKVDKAASVDTLYAALDAPDYLVRKKAFELLGDPDLLKRYPGIPAVVENARAKKADQVLPYNPKSGTKLGQVLNTDADYRRALSRKNGSVKAIITTEKGIFTIDLLPEDAPLTVDNFIRLANSRYFNGVEVHRVVPNFVMQDGDPRGDGNGGPGWSIRCEINIVPYERGAVGMALSGKDTGGSQWFVTHSPQPHLDGGYTVFGRVNETGMKVVDNIVRGDKIISVKIVESNSPRRTQSALSKK